MRHRQGSHLAGLHAYWGPTESDHEYLWVIPLPTKRLLEVRFDSTPHSHQETPHGYHAAHGDHR